MIANLTTAITSWIQSVISFTVDAFEGVVPIFYGGEPEQLTIYGYLLLFGLAVGFVGLAIGFIRNLLQK